MENYQMWIGGQWVDAGSGQTFAVINPATEEEFARVPLGGPADVDQAVQAARKAFPVWSKKTQAERSKILNRFAAAMRENAGALAELDTLEHGTPGEATYNITMFATMMVEYVASAARTLTGDVIPALPNTLSYLKREPAGVCALIIPWNLPVFMMAHKLALALAPGNTCIIKPPSINSLTAIKFAEILEKLELPPGAVNIVTGPGGSVGEALASHPGVDLVGFTGSSETGKAIMSAASQTVKRLILELGGKNPAIVLEDADLDKAVEVLGHHQFFNSGMTCGSPGRYYIHEKVYDQFVEKLLAAAKKVLVGDPTDPKTDMGPVVSAEHRDRVESCIRSGVEEGATLLLGGERPVNPPLDKGYYVLPTILTGVTQNMTIAREEIFGPVACVMKFSSHDDVIALANDNAYGLCASVWTKDMARGIKYGNELRVGSFFLNQHNHLAPEFPWGGIKESGIGKEGSLAGLKEYTELKLVCLMLDE